MSGGITARDFNPSDNADVDTIKEAANKFAEVVKNLPPSRRRSISLMHIETASMFAVKSCFYNDEDERKGS